MKILVTGVCGSLMREVTPLLVQAGHDVRGVDNYMRYGRQAPPDNIEFVEGDLTDPDLVRRSMRGVDGVIQAAAQIYGVSGFHRVPADILQRDTMLHGLVLRRAMEEDVQRVVYISSSMVYERQADVAREVDVPNMLVPLTDYGLSKLMGERLSRAFQEQYDLAYTIWRPFNIVGLHERAEGQEPGVSHVFADFIQRIVHEHQNPMLILGDGRQVRCFTWIGDVAAAIAAHSFVDATRNDDFNLGNPEPITMIDLAHRIHDLYQRMTGYVAEGPLRFTHQPIYDDDVKVRIPDVEKASRRLGWRAEVNVDDMLARCVSEALVRAPTGAG
ncbi:MAG: NAD(P)-dependent oxidoreductase [Chloroflexota bacterium]